MSENYYSAQLQQQEEAAIEERRKNAGIEPPRSGKEHTVGLALSGGGIRSATFALGVIQSLARCKKGEDQPLLRHVDYLSTVSGGGYVGAFLGRLYTRSKDDLDKATSEPARDNVVEQVETILTDSRSKPVDWLRENGRYLSPNGAGDLLIGVAVVLRNWITVHVVLSTFVLMLFVLMHSIRYTLNQYAFNIEDTLGLESARFNIWWSPYIVLPIFCFFVFVIPLAWTYWLVRMSRPVTQLTGLELIRSYLPWIAHFLLIGLAFFVMRITVNDGVRSTCALIIVLAILAILYFIAAGAWRLVSRREKHSNWSTVDKNSYVRHVLSSGLRNALGVTLVLLILAVVDSLGQTLYAYIQAAPDLTTLFTLLGTLGGVIGTLAMFSQKIASLGAGDPDNRRIRLPINILISVAAFGLLAVILIGLSTFSHGLAWGWRAPANNEPGQRIVAETTPARETPIQWHMKNSDDNERILVAAPEGSLHRQEPYPIVGEKEMLPRWLGYSLLVLVALSLAWGRIESFLNRSSYNPLYGARLTRAYLGASNRRRWGGQRFGVTHVVPDDGISLPDYQPHKSGGPLHLVNVTINETISGKSQIEQKDRKGLGMAVSHLGVSVGRRHHALWESTNPDGESEYDCLCPPHEGRDGFQIFAGRRAFPEMLGLEQWVTISGAAFSTGLGSRTNLGLSLLCGLFNVRLGYWWNSGVNPSCRDSLEPLTVAKGMGRFVTSLFPVQMFLLDEFTARFHGPSRQVWYLSDGGHFENMACYELIRRRVPVIILCDAEQDEAFTYAGIANLVRKARTDFNAEVRFLDEDELDQFVAKPVRDVFGTLEQLRRGRWSDEPVNAPATVRTDNQIHKEQDKKRISLDASDAARLSLAHAALAKVTYNDGGGTSYIVYIKPTLTGDEPADVLQYHGKHPAFPHESTIDQFFDEAQWESYRRLGEHIANVLFDQDDKDDWTPRNGVLRGGPVAEPAGASADA